jgi:hypothetical protein
MNVDSRMIFRDIDSILEKYPNATSRSIAEKLGRTRQEIEQVIRETEGKSLQEYRASKRLAVAFKQLGASRTGAGGPWEKERTRPRVIIPKTTVQYSVYRFRIFKGAYSNPCPLVDLSAGGLAFLDDFSLVPGARVSLLIAFPKKESQLKVEGRVVYAVATGIAGFRWRIGIQFLPFAAKKGYNDPKILEVLKKFETSNGASGS